MDVESLSSVANHRGLTRGFQRPKRARTTRTPMVGSVHDFETGEIDGGCKHDWRCGVTHLRTDCPPLRVRSCSTALPE